MAFPFRRCGDERQPLAVVRRHRHDNDLRWCGLVALREGEQCIDRWCLSTMEGHGQLVCSPPSPRPACLLVTSALIGGGPARPVESIEGHGMPRCRPPLGESKLSLLELSLLRRERSDEELGAREVLAHERVVLPRAPLPVSLIGVGVSVL